MDKIDPKIKLHIHLGIFAIIWVILLIVSGTTSILDLVSVAKKFPLAVTLYAFLAFIFTKWAWRWRIFRGWLIKIPDIQGTWRGSLVSTWVNKNTNDNKPIQAILAIRQNFNRIDCSLYTKESSSYSTAAEINKDQGGNLYFSYNYTNRPKVSLRERSEIHDGAAILRIIKSPSYALEGEYWTSRKTTGEMKFMFETSTIAETFITEQAKD